MVLPHPSLLFYDQVLPQLSRRTSEAGQLSQAGQLSRAGSLVGRLPATPGGSSAASPGASPEASPPPAPAVGPAAGEDEAGVHGGASGGAAVAPAGSRVGRWVGGLRRRRQLSALLRQQKTVPAGEALQSVVLQNKAPHWNEGLRCWCLNFRGRVKLASVKNFQARAWEGPEWGGSGAMRMSCLCGLACSVWGGLGCRVAQASAESLTARWQTLLRSPPAGICERCRVGYLLGAALRTWSIAVVRHSLLDTR